MNLNERYYNVLGPQVWRVWLGSEAAKICCERAHLCSRWKPPFVQAVGASKTAQYL